MLQRDKQEERRRRLLLEMAAGGGSMSYAQYIASLAPLVWLKFNETSGTTVVNYGSGGATFDGTWTPGAGAQGQTDSLGVNEAYLFDGADSVVSVPVSGAFSTGQAFTIVFLNKPSSAGESSLGTFFRFGASATELRFNALTSLVSSVDISGTDPGSTTTTGLTAAQNAVIAMTWDYGGDKLIRLYKGQGTTLTEYAYSSQVAGGGGGFANRGTPLYIGNISTGARTYAGLIGEFLFWPSILTTQQLTTITGLINAS